VISVFVAFAVVAILVVNMPASALRSDAGRLTDPFVQATGLDQNWGIFASPRTLSAYVNGRIDFADGSSAVVPISTRHGLGAFVDYRWQKYEELIRVDDGKSLWADYARYLARESRTGGRVPVRVSLVRRFADTRPPGPGPERDPWQTYTFFVYTVPSSS
jgi:hypothetical protein